MLDLIRSKAAAAVLALAALPATAAPPQLATQAPGYFRQSFGEVQVTALYDGVIDLPTSLLKGLDAQGIQQLLARMFIGGPRGVQTAVNAYLVHTGRQLLLVDTGAGACFGPTLGQMPANLKAAGYTPADVDAVLVTHLHPDHLCGLLDADGRPAFPNATVWAAKPDADFWLDAQTAAKAPKDMQPFFAMARKAAAPYQAAGRLRTFAEGDAIVPHVRAVATPGHTPGHTSFLVGEGAHALLVWGDIVHSHAVQFAHPEVSIEFDVDQPTAIDSRQKLFARAAREGWWVGGAHLPFPGIGHVRADAKGYAWVPVEYGPVKAAP
jgi:glyoxylase-like metal-dependent hydrolase (beta-lactamase superfamily II)